MSIDREFRFLNKNWNSLNSWISAENSVNKWKARPFKMVDFIRTSTLKYLIPALLLGVWCNELNKDRWDKTVYDVGESPMILDDASTDYNFDPIQIKTVDYLFDMGEDSRCFPMWDEGYDKNCISSIPLDEELNYAPWTHMSQTDKENIYLTMYKRLSEKDYQDLFKWLKDLKQWNLGNCYFVIAIRDLARSKYFDTLMRTSVERLWEDNFNLYMPLWEPWWLKVSITSEDLKATTIWWPLWYKILEIWFAKYLLFKKGIISSPDIVLTDELMKKMKSWYPWDAMMSLLWPKSFENERIKNESSNKSQIVKWLEKFDPKNLGSILIITKQKKWKTDKNFYEVWWQRIYYRHAYSVCGVEKNWKDIKSVTLDNPWNNEKKPWWSKITLSISDFFNCFSIADMGHITNNFLNLSTMEGEIKVVDSIDRSAS